MRLNRFLASAGLGSRRSCEELIVQGRVEVNGETITFPGAEIDDAAEVRLDGERIRLPRRWLYYKLHKPAGYITTLSDEKGRATIEEFFGRLRGRIFPIGRLDRASEGLILLTNNGDLAHRLLHPRYQQERTYLAWVRPAPTLEACRLIECGVQIGPEEYSGPARIRVLSKRSDPARVRITLREGKYREVRRIFSSVGSRVLVLRRVSYAGILLEDLEPGSMRPLTRDEVALLAHRTGLSL